MSTVPPVGIAPGFAWSYENNNCPSSTRPVPYAPPTPASLPNKLNIASVVAPTSCKAFLIEPDTPTFDGSAFAMFKILTTSSYWFCRVNKFDVSR